MQRAVYILLTLLMLALLCGLLALSLGSSELSWSSLLRVVTGQEQGIAYEIVMRLRLPRALNAFSVGALLALAGALMQVMLRNPLADPYILGISGGAAVATLAAILLGIGGVGGGAAFAGALLSMVLVFGLARGVGSYSSARLLLTGVVVAAGWSAMLSFLLTLAPDRELRGILFWLMGDLGSTESTRLGPTVLVLGLVLCWPFARSLNVLARGELAARTLGVPVTQLRWYFYALASLFTAVAVTIAGSIGFVGLVAPHVVRLVVGSDHRVLLPASALFGGSLLLLADTVARTAFAPQQMPVGVLTALLGVPLFLFFLARSRGGV